MSVRLYPEIMVFSLVVRKIDQNLKTKNDFEEVSLSINECIQRQEDINYSPALNVFTGPIDSFNNWIKKDYEEYFNNVKLFYYYRNNDCYVLPLKYVFGNDIPKEDNRDEWLIKLRNRLIIKGAYKFEDLDRFVYKKYDFHEGFKKMLRKNCQHLYVDENGVVRTKKKN